MSISLQQLFAEIYQSPDRDNLRSQLAPKIGEYFSANRSAIGAELWITENSVKQALKRMFRKLDVSSRAALVAHLFATCS